MRRTEVHRDGGPFAPTEGLQEPLDHSTSGTGGQLGLFRSTQVLSLRRALSPPVSIFNRSQTDFQLVRPRRDFKSGTEATQSSTRGDGAFFRRSARAAFASGPVITVPR